MQAELSLRILHVVPMALGCLLSAFPIGMQWKLYACYAISIAKLISCWAGICIGKQRTIYIRFGA